MQTFSAYKTFYRESRRRFHTTGAILPSSRFLGEELARYVREGRGAAGSAGRRILEVGPGSGSVTDALVAHLGEADRLDLVEINEEFVALLRRRFEQETRLGAVAPRVRILHRPVEQMLGEEPYDLIVSGLPLNNFAAPLVAHILATLTSLLRAGGTFSFFEYIAIRRLKGALSNQATRERLRAVGGALTGMLNRCEVRRVPVWRNVPPAWVHHVDLHRQPNSGTPSSGDP